MSVHTGTLWTQRLLFLVIEGETFGLDGVRVYLWWSEYFVRHRKDPLLSVQKSAFVKD